MNSKLKVAVSTAPYSLFGLWLIMSSILGPSAEVFFPEYVHFSKTLFYGRILLVACFVASCIIFAACRKLGSKQRKVVLGVASGVCACGMLLASLPSLGLSPQLLIWGAFLRGISGGIIALSWLSKYARLKGNSIGLALAGSLLVYGIVCMFLRSAQAVAPHVVIAVLTLCPLLSGIGCIFVSDRDADVLLADERRQEPLSGPGQAVLCALDLLYGVLFGLFQSSFFNLEQNIGLPSFSAFSLFMVVLFIIYDRAKDYGLGLRYYGVAASFALVVCVLFNGAAPHLVYVVTAILWMTQVWFGLMIFTDTEYDIPGFFMHSGSFGLAALSLGVLISMFVVSVLDSSGFDLEMVIATSFAGISILSVSFLPSKNRKVSSWGFAAFTLPESRDSLMRRRCEEIEEEFELTKREAEVALLLAQGGRADTISEKLFISPLTTKTHMRNMYAKIGVHSRDEFMDVLMEKEGAAVASKES